MRTLSLNALNRTLTFLVAASCAAGCAVGSDISPEEMEPGTEAAEEAVSTPEGDAITSNVSCSTDQNKTINLLCNLPGVSCPTKTCAASTTQFEVYTGVTNNVPNVPFDKAKSNGYGARGRRIAEAGLCLLRDLATKTNEVKAADGGFSATQRVGFESFDKTTKTVKAWRQMEVCAPIFGCVNPPTQSFSATLVSSTSLGAKMVGDFPVNRSWALQFKANGQSNALNINLPSLSVQTPAGPLTVTPSASYSANLPVLPGSKTYTPLYVRGVSPYPANFPEWWTGDTAGRYPGEATESMLAASGYQPGGWVSQIALGTRGPESSWTPITGTASRDKGRPDLELDRARSTPEKADSSVLQASASIVYDPTSLLPSFLKSSPLKITQAQVFVRPKMTGMYEGQFDVVAAESHALPADVGSSATLSQVRMPSAASAHGQFEMEVGLDLAIEVCLPFVGCKNVVSAHPRTGIPLADYDSFKAGPTASASSWLSGDAPKINSGVWNNITVYTVDEGTYSSMTTPSGATVSNPQQFVNDCLAQQPAAKTAPAPAYTPPNPNELQNLLEFPCNVCVYVDPSSGASQTGPVSVLPSTSNPMPSGKKWQCDGFGSTLGCMDMCRYDPATGATVVTRSATDLVDQQCSSAYRVK